MFATEQISIRDLWLEDGFILGKGLFSPAELADFHQGRTEGFLFSSRLRAHLLAFLAEEPYAMRASLDAVEAGEEATHYVQDNALFPAYPGTCITVLLALSPCESGAGCPQLVPMSHKLPLFSDLGGALALPNGFQLQDVPMQPGDVLIMHGNLIHGSAENRKSEPVIRLLARYVTVDTHENMFSSGMLHRFDGSTVEI
jgi:ectoine hydroxylase-related dioxygenase (phytanoyl-CoA dioxygenase family)